MADDFAEYVRDETNRRFDEVREDIRALAKTVDERLTELQEFKISMVVSTRWISLIVSAFCGLITLLVTVAVTVWATNKTVQSQPPQPSKGGQENVGFIDSVGTRISR
jgi:hypothetical protein